MRGRSHLLLIYVLGLAFICGIVAIAVYMLGGWLPEKTERTLNARSTAEAFLTALKVGNYDQALALCTDDLKKDLIDSRNFETMIEGNQVTPRQWTWERTRESRRTGLAFLDGETRFANGRRGVVNLQLRLIDGNWKITYVNLQPIQPERNTR